MTELTRRARRPDSPGPEGSDDEGRQRMEQRKVCTPARLIGTLGVATLEEREDPAESGDSLRENYANNYTGSPMVQVLGCNLRRGLRLVTGAKGARPGPIPSGSCVRHQDPPPGPGIFPHFSP